MTITLDSKSFRDVAKKLDDLAAENQLTKDMYQQILEEEGFDEEEFKKTYNEYIQTPDEELIQPTEITGLPVVDPIIRATGRAFGEAGRETVDFFEDVAPVTTDKVKNIFNEVADKTGEYIPESVKDFTDELFDPYHGEGIYGEAENMVGNIGSYLVPAGAMVKIAKGANALAKTNRTIRGGLANVNRALGRKGRKAAKVAGFLGVGAGSATMVEKPSENAVNLLREYFPESTEFLERLEIDTNDSPAKQRLNAFLNAFTQMEFLEPKSAIATIRHKLNLAGLDFEWNNKSSFTPEETLKLPLARWGGSFGTTPTHDLSQGFYQGDNIAEFNDGKGLELSIDVYQEDNGLYQMDAKILPKS